MPSLAKIQAYWAAREDLLEIFPDHPIHYLGTGWLRPCCFRCGWRAPDTRDEVDKAWNAAAGWLERCHLQDHRLGGAETVDNLVPLCMACHKWVSGGETWQEGVDYVNERTRCSMWFQIITDDLCRRVRGLETKQRRWLEAQVRYFRACYEAAIEGHRLANPSLHPTHDDPHYAWPRPVAVHRRDLEAMLSVLPEPQKHTESHAVVAPG